MTQLWRTKENHSAGLVVCQRLFVYCPLGMQVRGSVNLKPYLFKVTSISPCIQTISGLNCFTVFCLYQANKVGESMHLIAFLKFYFRQKARALERTCISLPL